MAADVLLAGTYELGLMNITDNPFNGIANHHRDFILAITSTLAKYESANTGRRGKRSPFSEKK